MKVILTDSFYKSLDTIRRHNTWWYKIYQAVRYDIPRFFKTTWKFRKELYKYYEWDHSYPMNIFKKGLLMLADHIEEYGNEVDDSRLKKVTQMRRAIEILELHYIDDFIKEAEKELGYNYNTKYVCSDEEPKQITEDNNKIAKVPQRLEQETWDELFKSPKGQDIEEYLLNKNNKGLSYDEWVDGSGLKNWWD